MASIWRDPIFDRTYQDIDFALRQIDAWKQSHTHVADVTITNDNIVINEGDVTVNDDSVALDVDGSVHVENGVLHIQFGDVYDLKGCLNVFDLTRIEDNISYLSERLNNYRYPTSTATKVWTRTNMPTTLDMQRIAANIRAIRHSLGDTTSVTTVPEALLSYEDINTIEYDLYCLKQILNVMENSFIQSGTYKCGATSRLPIRR